MTRLLPFVPVPAVLFTDGQVTAANEPATVLLKHSLDELRSDFRGGFRDDASRATFDGLLDDPGQQDVPVVLKWGDEIPTQSLAVSASRLDDATVLVVLIDDNEAQRLDGILTAMSNGQMTVDDKNCVTWLSRGTIETYGTPFPLGTCAVETTHPDDAPRMEEMFRSAMASPRRKLRESTRSAHADFPDVWWKMDLMVMNLLDDPSVGGIAVSFGPHADNPSDIDADDLETNRMSDIMPAGIVQAMSNGHCYYRNRLALQQLGEIPLRESATVWIERTRPSDRDALRNAAEHAIAGERSTPVVAAMPRAGGTSWYRFEFTPQFSTSGAAAGFMVTSLDVTAEMEARQELQRAQDHLWHLANHDALTGLPNRPAVMERIDAALNRSRREPHGVALLYCDLDGFKPVNDEHGHEAGDTVLLVVGQRMLQAVRDTDAVGRFGGDEFVVLCESFGSVDDVTAVAERVEREVRQPISVGAPPFDVSIGVTVGVAIAEPDESSDSLLSRADAAMYERKQAREDGADTPHRR